MQPTSVAPKTRSNDAFGIVAIVLLVAGLGAGYVLGRPPLAPAPNPWTASPARTRSPAGMAGTAIPL